MTKKTLCAIVIPVYKSELSESEKRSFLKCLKTFKGRAIFLAAPNKLDLSAYRQHDESLLTAKFENEFFKDIESYNRLLLSNHFYKRFSDYKYILIYQLDAYVFKDELEYWCKKGYDYIGAPIINNHFVTPWLKHLNKRNLLLKLGILKNDNVGNGGFSLRKVSSFIFNSQLFKKETEGWSLNEDLFWSFRLPVINPFFRIPSMSTAVGFSIEGSPSYCYELNKKQLPFGCHAWEKYEPEFWKKFIRGEEE